MFSLLYDPILTSIHDYWKNHSFDYTGASLIAQLVKNPPAMQETSSWFLGQKIRWRRDRLPTSVFLGFPGASAGKESSCNAGDLGSIHGLGRSPEEGKGYLIQYSGLENSTMESQRVGHGWATFTFILYTNTDDRLKEILKRRYQCLPPTSSKY